MLVCVHRFFLQLTPTSCKQASGRVEDFDNSLLPLLARALSPMTAMNYWHEEDAKTEASAKDKRSPRGRLPALVDRGESILSCFFSRSNFTDFARVGYLTIDGSYQRHCQPLSHDRYRSGNADKENSVSYASCWKKIKLWPSNLTNSICEIQREINAWLLSRQILTTRRKLPSKWMGVKDFARA